MSRGEIACFLSRFLSSLIKLDQLVFIWTVIKKLLAPFLTLCQLKIFFEVFSFRRGKNHFEFKTGLMINCDA